MGALNRAADQNIDWYLSARVPQELTAVTFICPTFIARAFNSRFGSLDCIEKMIPQSVSPVQKWGLHRFSIIVIWDHGL